MAIEENVTMTETTPDGTQTTVDITTTKADDASLADGDDKTLVEEVVEALFDDDADDDDVDTDLDDVDAADTDEGDPVMFEGTPTDEEISTDSVEFTVGEDGFPMTDARDADVPADFANTPESYTPVDPGYSAAPADSTADSTDSSTAQADAAAAAESSAQQANVDAAKDAQAAADQFVAHGDYAAAAEAREAAENAAYQAGDSSMLGASDSSNLENAAYKQEVAQDYREQQGEHIAGGDYEAAKEDAQNVAYQTGDADYQASGSDHTGQADSDVQNLDWAVWDEKNADYNAQNAEAYAAEGDFDNAQASADRAEGYQATADEYADRGDPSNAYQDHDPSSDVMTGGSYDAGSYDASIASVDTGIDTPVDTSAAAASYDTATDDTV